MSINILKYAAVLLASAALTAGCQKFEEPEPFVPAEMEATMTLAEFKALYTGFPMEITDGSIVLEGKVISTDRSGNVYRSLYIEDATAGLEVKIGKTGLYNDYKEGQTISIDAAKSPAIAEIAKKGNATIPPYMEVDLENLKATLTRAPQLEEIPVSVKIMSVIEYYAR